ncbi:MAG: dTDP-4-dehydrorhamnose reductase [Candidatus Acidiferrales bacterium]
MNLKILLIGKNGQVGADLASLLPSLGEVIAVDRSQLDLSQPCQIRRTILQARPQIIVNAAAYTAVDKAENDESMAFAVNAEAPGVMAETAKEIGAALVHYSTDYVFDGSKRTPYCESDSPNPINAYGKTKLAGELAIQASGVPHLIFRTAWVYATRGKNFLLTVLRLATQQEELRIVRDQIGAPTWSREIADSTARILAPLSHSAGALSSIGDVTGVYHMTAAGDTTWHGFAQAILDEVSQAPPELAWLASATNGRPILARRILPITTAEYPTPACRPAYSVLSNSRLLRDFSLQLPDWRTQLRGAFQHGA